MKHKLPAIACLILVLTGCTDTVDSLSREYRNMNNEGIDAMSMITSDQMATRMAIRVFRPMKDRYEGIDNRLKAVFTNRNSNQEFVKATFESNGMHLFLTELEVNKQRYALEMIRLRGLVKKAMDDNPGKSEQEACPGLAEVILKDSTLSTLKDNITKPKLVFEYMTQFPTMKSLKDYDKLHKAFAEKRRGSFKLPENFKIVD